MSMAQNVQAFIVQNPQEPNSRRGKTRIGARGSSTVVRAR